MQNRIRWETFWDRIINWVITEFWPCFNKHRDLVIQKKAITLSHGRWAIILRGCFGLKQVSEFLLRIPFRLCWLAIDTHFNIGYLFLKKPKMGLFSLLICPVCPQLSTTLVQFPVCSFIFPWTPLVSHFSSNRAVSAGPVSSQSPSWEQSSLNSTLGTFLTQENTFSSSKWNSGRID